MCQDKSMQCDAPSVEAPIIATDQPFLFPQTKSQSKLRLQCKGKLPYKHEAVAFHWACAEVNKPTQLEENVEWR